MASKIDLDLWAILLIAGGFVVGAVAYIVSGVHYRIWEENGGIVYQAPLVIIVLTFASLILILCGMVAKVLEVVFRRLCR